MKNRKNLMGMLALALVFGLTVTGCRVFDDMYKISNYLSLAVRVGRHVKGPVPLAVKINLDDNWGNLLRTIDGTGVYVNLDLSRCTMTNTEFNPGSTGSKYIVSLDLPDAVTSIAGDFNKFTSLAVIRFPASTSIGEVNPFVDCSLLTFRLKGRGDLSAIENGRVLIRNGNELVSYPSAKDSVTLSNITAIGRSAFNSTELESISLPDVITVGIRAFSNCKNLQTVNLPAATTVGELAFYGNTDLQTLNIPAVTIIGNNAVANTKGENLTITVGRRMETIGTGMFSEVGERKNVTVRTLQSEVENITAMREAFRGRGWNEGSFTLAAQRTIGSGRNARAVSNVNNSINLTVEGY